MDEMQLLDINDFCLTHIFDYCGIETLVSISKVCKRLNALTTNFHFPKKTAFTYSRWTHDQQKLDEILQCIGKYLVILKIRHPDSIEIYRLIGNLVGDRIRELTIDTEHLSEEMMQPLNAILRHVEKLNIFVGEDQNGYVELHSRCPNVRQLHIQWNTPFSQNTGHWPHLEKFVIGDNEYFDRRDFVDFMKNNPQLRILKIGCFNCVTCLHDISNHARQLEDLTIFQNYSDLAPNKLYLLKDMTHLKNLTFRCVENDLDDIFHQLTKLETVTKLHIQAKFDGREDEDYLEPIPQNITAIALNMPQLEEFGIANCKLKAETVLEFLRFGLSLRRIHIHECDFEFKPEDIEKIAKIRSKRRNQINPLILYVTTWDENVQNVRHLLSIPTLFEVFL